MASLAYKEVEAYFDIKPKKINIKIHKTRKSFNKQLNRETLEWEVANASYSGSIDILHPDCFAKESTHAREDFLPILKHEIAHIFLDLLSGGHKIPKWLDEGFSSHVAGLNSNSDLAYIEEGFCRELGTPDGWNKHSGHGAYKTARMFVKFLVKKYSIEKVDKLIATSEENYNYDNFNRNFKNIFSKNIDDAEKEFIKSIKSSK